MNIQQKIIMITGSSGTIGSNLLLSFENENKIIALDKKIPKKKFKNVFYHQCDLNDRTSRKKEPPIIIKIKKINDRLDVFSSSEIPIFEILLVKDNNNLIKLLSKLEKIKKIVIKNKK